MSQRLTFEMEDFASPEIAPTPAYYGNIDRSHKSSQPEVRERLIPRKPLSSQETTETLKQPPSPEPPIDPVGYGFSQGYEHVQGYEGNVWLPGFWIQFPWRVILPIVGCLLCLSGSIAILVRSDGQPVDHWSISPTVYLALLTTITNMLLRYAFKEGVAISWWYKAVRGGTVQDLHKHWSSGDGFWSALGSGRHFNLASLGCIAATLVVIDQPLIQRASTVVSVPRSYFTNITATIAPEIPWGYTGYQSGRGSLQQLMTQPMIAAFNDYNTQASITSGFSGCKDSCKGSVEAGGLAAQCSTITGPVQYLTPYALSVGQGPDGTLPPDLLQYDSPFSVNFTLMGQGTDNNNKINGTQIFMIVAYSQKPTGTCAATRTQRTCSLRPATLRYPVTIQNGTLTLGDLTKDATVTSLSPQGNFTDGGGDFSIWTLGGIYLAANSLFNSNGTYDFSGGHGLEMFLTDTLSNQYLEITPGPNKPYNTSDSSQQPGVLYSGLSIPQACNSSWTDPTNNILSSLNQIAFRVSMQAATYPYRDTNAAPAPQVIPMLETSNINVFHSEHKYLIANTVLTIFFMALVLPSFIGWWELGRRVTLDPVEIAKAFDAPMFQGPGSNAPLWQLVRDYGQRSVRYGEVEGYGNGQMVKRQLKLVNPQEATRPTPGTVYE